MLHMDIGIKAVYIEVFQEVSKFPKTNNKGANTCGGLSDPVEVLPHPLDVPLQPRSEAVRLFAACSSRIGSAFFFSPSFLSSSIGFCLRREIFVVVERRVVIADDYNLKIE